jgi:hypothetical protein
VLLQGVGLPWGEHGDGWCKCYEGVCTNEAHGCVSANCMRMLPASWAVCWGRVLLVADVVSCLLVVPCRV